jgi:hypothetical protein
VHQCAYMFIVARVDGASTLHTAYKECSLWKTVLQ